MTVTEDFEGSPHQPVLYQEILQALNPHSPGRYVDATVGAGGHSWGILQASEPSGSLLGLDLDPQALALASRRLAVFEGRFTLQQASYVDLKNQVRRQGWEGVDGIVIDLGVSSMQLDSPERGFSFRADGPLDMRFGPTQPQTAADVVNHLPEADLADILWKYGEESQSRRIARSIVQARPLETTLQLAQVIASASRTHGKGHSREHSIHPATRSFQALRIYVNGELDALEKFLPAAVDALAPGGRLAVISFHSLEDRIVKQYFRRESVDCICPPQQPICTCGHKASIDEINRRPIIAGEEETRGNSRSRSARLRIVQKREVA